MSTKVEPWAREWLEGRRAAGEKCLEIKVSNGRHYVYRSTTRYDRTDGKAHKTSVYIGSLDKEKGMTAKKRTRHPREGIASIRESGPLRLLDRCAGDMARHLKARFPDEWDSLYALAMIRCISPVPLKRASALYEKHEPVRGMAPPMSPKTLSAVLAAAGRERDSQLLFFKDMDPGCEEMAFDLTEFFTSSGELTLGERGRNPEHDDRNQANIVMTCSMDLGIPTYMRAIPGSMRDVKAVCASVREMGWKGVIFVGDRGFHSKANIALFLEEGVRFLLPVKRSSALYDEVSVSAADFFFWNEKAVRFGKARGEDGLWLYRFENDEMALGEDRNALRRVESGELDFEGYLKLKPRMGQMVVVSDLDREPKQIYMLYKRRDKAEKRFRTLFSLLEADSTYLRDRDHVNGHLFVTFLSLAIVARLEDAIRMAGLLPKMSVEDVLLAYSKSFAVEREGGAVDYEVPKKLEDLDAKLGFNIFPILRS